jgi:predicted nucleic acid-binding protein
MAALDEIDRAGHAMVAAAVLFSEFPSLLRRMTAQGRLTTAEGQQLFDLFRRMPIESVNATPALVQQSWALANHLDQSDTFDSIGYVSARSTSSIFWTADKRFANAASSRKLTGIRTFTQGG